MISIRLITEDEADELINNLKGLKYKITTGSNGESVYSFSWSGSPNLSIVLSAEVESNEYFDQKGIKYKNIYKES